MGCCFSKHSSKEVTHSPESTSVRKLQETATVALDEKQCLPLVADSLSAPVPVKPPASASPKQSSPAYGPVSLPSAETLKEKSEKHNAEYTVPLNSPKKEASSPSKGSQNFPPSPRKKSARKTEDEDCLQPKLPSSAKKEWLSQAVAATVSSKVASNRNSSSSRDPSPVEVSRARVRPSSPMKRSPSVKEPQDGPHLTRSSSGKASSPSRAGAYGSAKTQGDKRDAAEEGMRGRPLHRRSLSKESFADAAAHKRSASRDSAADVSSSDVRKPSPPKKIPTFVPSAEANMLNKRPASKEDPLCESRLSAKNSGHRKIPNQESSSANLAPRGRSPVLRTSNAQLTEVDNSNANTRTARRKEKFPLRRTSNGLTTPQSMTKIIERHADVSINSDNPSLCQSDHAPSKAKDFSRTRKVGDRLPLKEISDNSSFQGKSTATKQGFRECAGVIAKARDEVPSIETSENALRVGKAYPKAKPDQAVITATNFADKFDKHREHSLEVKAENLVLEGKSVLGAFKALEEFRMKQDSVNPDVGKGVEGEMRYSHQFASKSLIQSLHAENEKGLCERENSHQTQEFQRMSTKRSCEPFLFPDVQSLLMPESEGMEFDGGLTMPASISKACSILRAVADLNMGTSIYSKKKGSQDEIEQPNLLSFQFGGRDPQK